MDSLSATATQDPEGFLGHPVNAFKLMKRLNTEWGDLESLVLSDTTDGTPALMCDVTPLGQHQRASEVVKEQVIVVHPSTGLVFHQDLENAASSEGRAVNNRLFQGLFPT